MLSIEEALAAAEDARQDLVEVSPQASPPVCRLQDYNKAKYAAKLREKVRSPSVAGSSSLAWHQRHAETPESCQGDHADVPCSHD